MFHNHVSQTFFSQLTILKHHSYKILAPAMTQAQGEFLWIKRALGGVDGEISWTRFSLGCVSLRKFKIGFLNPKVRKRILRFFTKQIKPRSFGSWCVKGTEESTSRVDSSVPLTRHDPRDLGLICSEKKHKIRFRILLHSRIQSWIFL